MFGELMGILGEAINDTIDAYNAIDNERAEIVEAIKKYNARAALYGKKPIVIMQENDMNDDASNLKKYFSEKSYTGKYKAESELNRFGFQKVSGSTWKRGNTIASIEYCTDRYGYIIKLF